MTWTWVKRVRNLAVAGLVAAVAIVGLQPPTVASAAAVASGTGAGVGKSATFTLDAGFYTVDFTFNGNSDEWGRAWMEASLMGSAGSEGTVYAFAGESGRQQSTVQIGRAGSFWVYVADAAADARWSFTITRLTAPTAVSSTYTAVGAGGDSGPLVRLAAGGYRATVTLSGNVDGGAAMPFVVGLNSDLAPDGILLANGFDKAGTYTKAFLIEKAGVYWGLASFVVPSAKWQITIRSTDRQFAKAPIPTISGVARVGTTLTAKAGTWNPKASLKYRWYRNGAEIGGATKSTYKPTAADRGNIITVKVTGSKAGYTTTTRTSKATSKIAAGKLTAKTPKITGKAKVGRTLKVKTDSWKPSGVKLVYQWYRVSSPITGASKSSYKLTAADQGKKIKVKVTGAKNGYTTASKISKATDKVKK